MKPTKLTIKNIGIIENITIEIDKPLLLFYGDLMQGKTTILNALKWCFGGAYPSGIIRHGEKEALVLFEFQENGVLGSISRSWYVNKEGATTDRPISFIRSGKPVPKPANEIKKFLNPYLLDNDFLKNMTEAERKAYFVQLFGVDTSGIDKETNKIIDEAKTLRVEIKAYGEIDTTEVKPTDTQVLKAERKKITDAHDDVLEKTNKENKKIIQHNKDVESNKKRLITLAEKIQSMKDELALAEFDHSDCESWLRNNPLKEEKPKPLQPDTSDLDSKISNAAAVAVKYEQYQKNLKRAEEKAAKEASLKALETTQRDLKAKKISRLTEAGEKSGITGLVFNEDGSFSFNETSSGMLSTSQLMSLSQELSGLYPSGFGLDLIDRAESLGFGIGKNILEFVEKAKREDKTILAAIVGERPATAPPEVGVFVVSDGKIKE